MNKAQVPQRIRYNGSIVTSPAKIANIANEHYINKIRNINESLKGNGNPIALLKEVVPRRSNERPFRLKFISLKETIKMIRSLKCSNSSGFDDITNQILKKLDLHIAYQICHMINCVMRTAKSPKIFKTTKIIPVSKPGKPTDDIDSFRPLNNLSSLEKLIEHWLGGIFVQWLEAEDVISMHHHGGRQGYLTLTVKAEIDKKTLTLKMKCTTFL